MSSSKSTNITWHRANIGSEERAQLLGSRGCVVWLTGLSGSGKSTIGRALEERLLREGRYVTMLDGDNLRHGLNADLGFSPQDRSENNRRVGEVAKLMAEANLIVIAAFVSPYRADRDRIKERIGERFVEVYVNTPLEVCESRDPKGLYRRARAGEIVGFTGIDAPYEAPLEPDLTTSAALPLEQCIDQLLSGLRQLGHLS